MDPALAHVRGSTPEEVASVWRACQPWPWLLAGTTPDVPAGLPELIGSLPVPIHWIGQPPAGLPARPVVHRDWTELVAELDQLHALLEHGVAGVRLLRNRGIRAPDGRIVLDVAHLEGLLAAPGGLCLAPNGAAGPEPAIEREIRAGGLPLRLDRAGGTLRLVGYPPAL